MISRKPNAISWRTLVTGIVSLLLVSASRAAVTDVSIQGIEITQAVQCFDQTSGYTQCPDNFLKLSDHKPAVVRVYLGHAGAPACPERDPYAPVVQQATVQIAWIVTPPDVTLPTLAEQKFDIPCSTDRGDLRKDLLGTANFLIPAEAFTKKPGQTKTLSVEATVTTGIHDANPANDSATVSIDVEPRDVWNVSWLPFFYDPEPLKNPNTCRHDRTLSCTTNADCAAANGGPGGECWKVYAGPHVANVAQAATAAPVMQYMLPLPTTYKQHPGVFPWSSQTTSSQPFDFLCSDCVDIRDSNGSLLSHLELFRMHIKPRPDSLVGWLPNAIMTWELCSGQGTITKIASDGGSVAIMQCPDTLLDQHLMVHELSHNMGLDDFPNSFCWPFPPQSSNDTSADGVKEEGIIVASVPYILGTTLTLWDVIPASETELTVSIANQRWISPFSWNFITGEEFTLEWSSCDGLPPPTGGGSWGSGNGMAISGEIDSDGNSGGLDPITTFQTEGVLPPFDPAAAYCIDLEDTSGTSLLSHCFDLPFGLASDGDLTESRSFAFLLPEQPGTARVVLRRGTDILAARAASQNAPENTVVHLPALGPDPVNGPLEVEAVATDQDDDPLTYTLLYTPDGGDSVYPIVVNTPSGFGSVDMSALPGGDNARLRVLVSDGFHTAAAESIPFRVVKKPPAAVVLAPQDGARISSATMLLLHGNGEDYEDGLLPPENLTWTSDKEVDPLGTGPELLLPAGRLVLGPHVITLTATDSDGNIAVDSISVEVVPVENSAPVAHAGDDLTVDEGTLVTLDGTWSYDRDADDTISYLWTQLSGPVVELDGADTATPSFNAPAVSSGGDVLEFELTVTDDDPVNSKSASDSVVVSVRNVNDPPTCDLAVASPDRLWPPDLKMVQVELVGVTDEDPVYNTVTLQVTGVSQDEPVNGLGDGDFSPDAVIQSRAPADSVLIRAERSGTGNGRVYIVNFVADDGFESCTGQVSVSVPHSLKSTAVDDGQTHDSTLP